MHTTWLVLADLAFFRLGKLIVGREATSYAMIPYLFNHTFTQQMHRLFSSSYESILTTISLYFFSQMTEQFD